MIIDTIDHLWKYRRINSYIGEAALFLTAHDFLTWKDGKNLIDGGAFYSNLTTARGRSKEEATMETHRRFIDIQVPLDKEETYGYTPLADLPEAEYNEEKDITKYPGVAAQSYVTCKPGMFAMFFPEDGHAPCIGEGDIRKIILKLMVDREYEWDKKDPKNLHFLRY